MTYPPKNGGSDWTCTSDFNALQAPAFAARPRILKIFLVTVPGSRRHRTDLRTCLGYPGGLAPPNSSFTGYGLDDFGFGHVLVPVEGLAPPHLAAAGSEPAASAVPPYRHSLEKVTGL